MKISKGGFAVSYTPFMLQGSVCVVEEYTALFLDKLGYNRTSIGMSPILGILTQAVGLPCLTYVADKYRARKLMLFLSLIFGIVVCLMFYVVPPPMRSCGSTVANHTLVNASGHSASPRLINATTVVADLRADPARYWLTYLIIFIAIRGGFELCRRLSRTLITVATVSHVGQEANKIGYYACWGYVGAGVSMLIIGIILWFHTTSTTCGNRAPDYAIVFLYAASGHFLALFFIPWINFEYLEHRVVDYNEVKQVLSRLHYIFILVICCYGGMCVAYLSRWEFWYIKQLGGNTVTMTISGVLRRPVNVALYAFSGKLIDKFGELNILNLSLFIFFATFAILAIFPVIWLVIIFNNIQTMSYVLMYVSCIVHFSKAASKASAAFFQGMVALLFTGVGQELGSVVIGVLFDSFGTTITFWILGSGSVFLCFLLTIYLFTVKDLEGYTKIRTESVDEK